jgi:hypothetical protein
VSGPRTNQPPLPFGSTMDQVAAIDLNRQGGSGERSELGSRDTDGQAEG